MTEIDRLQPVTEFSSEQERVAKAIAAGPRGGLRFPFQLLLNSPALAEVLSPVGEYLRYSSRLPPSVREAAILVAAHEYQCSYEWDAHLPIALSVGVTTGLVDEIRGTATTPDDGSPERLAVEFCRNILRSRGAPPTLQGRVIAKLGAEGLTDLVGLCGYYGTLAMLLNLARADE